MIGGTLAPLVGLGGSGIVLPMGIVIAGCELGALLVFLFLVRRAARPYALSSS